MKELTISMHEWKSLELTQVEENKLGPITTNAITIDAYKMINPVELDFVCSLSLTVSGLCSSASFFTSVILAFSWSYFWLFYKEAHLLVNEP